MSDRNVSLLGRRDVDVNIHTIEPWPRPDRERGPPDISENEKERGLFDDAADSKRSLSSTECVEKR